MGRFVSRCEREGREFRLSLGRLARDAARLQQQGDLPEEIGTLRGFNWFIGFAIDREHDDVILLAMHDPAKPPIDIDCLATAIWAVATGETPACSLDPDPDPAYQKAVVLGVERRSRWAETMIAADYDMKQIAQGLVDTPVVRSYAGRKAEALSRGRRTEGSTESNRWWFTRTEKDSSPRSIILADGKSPGSADLVLIHKNPVVLLTEKQIDGEFGTGATSREAEQFADSFTSNMDKIGCRYPSIGELLALYRLLDVMVHLRVLGRVAPPGEEFWLHSYRNRFEGPPEKLPTLTRTLEWSGRRGRVVYQHRMEVHGGVRMPMNLAARTIRSESSINLVRQILGL